MGLIDKLPLLNSKNKLVKIFGYFIYAFVILGIIGNMSPSEDIGATASPTAKADFSRENVTAETVLQELNGIKDDSHSVDLTELDSPRSGMERISVNHPFGENYIVDVWCPPHDYLSGYNVFDVASGTAVEVARRLFANPQIGLIRVMQQMDVGLDDPIKAIQIEISRETFSSFDWNDVKAQIKNDPETAFDIFGPCNIYTKGSSGYERPEKYKYNC